MGEGLLDAQRILRTIGIVFIVFVSVIIPTGDRQLLILFQVLDRKIKRVVNSNVLRSLLVPGAVGITDARLRSPLFDGTSQRDVLNCV